MLAGIIYGLHDYRLGEAEMPKIEKSTDVLLKVTTTAICTSEVHYAEGFQPLTAPFTTGHEFVGTIVEAGSDVKKFKVGDHVDVATYTTFAIRCFRIYLCTMPLCMMNKGVFIYLQAIGKPVTSISITMAREILFGVALPILLPLIWGLDGVLYSFPAADLLATCISVVVIVRTYKDLNDKPKEVTA